MLQMQEQVDFSKFKSHRTKIETSALKEQEILTSMLDKDCKYKEHDLVLIFLFILGIDVVNQVTSKVKNHHRIQTKVSIKDISLEVPVSTMTD